MTDAEHDKRSSEKVIAELVTERDELKAKVYRLEAELNALETSLDRTLLEVIRAARTAGR